MLSLGVTDSGFYSLSFGLFAVRPARLSALRDATERRAALVDAVKEGVRSRGMVSEGMFAGGHTCSD
jgi:hypothetical protein